MRAHLFTWETQGEGTLDTLLITIEMSSGRNDANGNPQKTQLTNEQAIALWDRIVGSFRLRPAGGAPAKSSDVGPPEATHGAIATTPLEP